MQRKWRSLCSIVGSIFVKDGVDAKCGDESEDGEVCEKRTKARSLIADKGEQEYRKNTSDSGTTTAENTDASHRCEYVAKMESTSNVVEVEGKGFGMSVEKKEVCTVSSPQNALAHKKKEAPCTHFPKYCDNSTVPVVLDDVKTIQSISEKEYLRDKAEVLPSPPAIRSANSLEQAKEDAAFKSPIPSRKKRPMKTTSPPKTPVPSRKGQLVETPPRVGKSPSLKKSTSKKVKRPRSLRKSSKRTPKKIDFQGDPWNQLSSWTDDDDKCDLFVPGFPKVYACKICGRVIEDHRRIAVKEAIHVLKAIDGRGEASRIVGTGKEGNKGEIWLGGQVAVKTPFFERENIKFCVTAAVGLPGGFKKRRTKTLKKTGAVAYDFALKDNSEQVIPWDELADVVKRIERHRLRGESVLVHCAAGQSRSSTVVIAYLLTFSDSGLKDSFRTFSKALRFAVSKRPMVRPNEGFQRQLKSFEEAGRFVELRDAFAAEYAKK